MTALFHMLSEWTWRMVQQPVVLGFVKWFFSLSLSVEVKQKHQNWSVLKSKSFLAHLSGLVVVQKSTDISKKVTSPCWQECNTKCNIFSLMKSQIRKTEVGLLIRTSRFSWIKDFFYHVRTVWIENTCILCALQCFASSKNQKKLSHLWTSHTHPSQHTTWQQSIYSPRGEHSPASVPQVLRYMASFRARIAFRCFFFLLLL